MQCLKIFYYRIDIFYTPSLLWFYLKLKTIFGAFARGVFPLIASSLNSCFQIKRLDQSNGQLLTISPDFFCHLGRTIFLKVVRIIGFLSLNQSGKLTLIRPSNNIKYTLQYIDYIWKKRGHCPRLKFRRSSSDYTTRYWFMPAAWTSSGASAPAPCLVLNCIRKSIRMCCISYKFHFWQVCNCHILHRDRPHSPAFLLLCVHPRNLIGSRFQWPRLILVALPFATQRPNSRNIARPEAQPIPVEVFYEDSL